MGFGSGIYFGKHSSLLLKLVYGLNAYENTCAFIFSTRGAGPPSFYHRSLRRAISNRGFTIVGEFSCKGLDTVGPLRIIGGINTRRPAEKDLARARSFAQALARDVAERQ